MSTAALHPSGGTTATWRRALAVSAGRTAVLGGTAVALSFAQSLGPDHRLFVCPLRALTGVPCPLCGGTTAAIELVRLDLPAALAANPFALIGGLLVALAPLALLYRGWRLTGRTSLAALAVALVLSEIWQLARFGLLT